MDARVCGFPRSWRSDGAETAVDGLGRDGAEKAAGVFGPWPPERRRDPAREALRARSAAVSQRDAARLRQPARGRLQGGGHRSPTRSEAPRRG
jgi:hypothetical protein